jgi:hypothetical protein
MAHASSFFERFGYLGTCVLPDKVLDDTPLTDPDTGLTQPSLRQHCQDGSLCSGLCYARILFSFTEGLYWADVAATPDLAAAERVVLTEADLTYALPWDERLYWRTPAQICCLMEAQAHDLAPLHPYTEPLPEAALLPAPVVSLVAVETPVEVTTDDLRAEFASKAAEHPRSQIAPRHTAKRHLNTYAVQQGLLQVLHRALQRDLALADHQTAQALQALTALVTRVRDFHQRTRQRVVNAVKIWDAGWRRWVWHLMLGVPEALLVAGDAAAAV